MAVLTGELTKGTRRIRCVRNEKKPSARKGTQRKRTNRGGQKNQKKPTGVFGIRAMGHKRLTTNVEHGPTIAGGGKKAGQKRFGVL